MEGMMKRVLWVAVVGVVGLVLLRGAGAVSADGTVAAVLYRQGGTPMGLTILTIAGTNATLKVTVAGATPSTTYSVRTCLPDTINGSGTYGGCNKNVLTLTTDANGAGTVSATYTVVWTVTIVVVTNVSVPGDL